MKTATNPMNGMAAVKLLYKPLDGAESDSNIQSSQAKIKLNLHPTPSLIPGVEYPAIERNLSLAYQKGYADAERLYRNDDAIAENKYLLNIFRKIVKEKRKELIKKGEIQPQTKEERKWRLKL
jgi:hypothetical protein